jgi:hypothetical protein
MSSAERPEADVAEQAREADPTLEENGELTPDLEAAVADVLDQLTDADPPDDEVRDLH